MQWRIRVPNVVFQSICVEAVAIEAFIYLPDLRAAGYPPSGSFFFQVGREVQAIL
jgi:hypothetical protein